VGTPITLFAVVMLPASGTPTWISVSLSIVSAAAIGWAFFGATQPRRTRSPRNGR